MEVNKINKKLNDVESGEEIDTEKGTKYSKYPTTIQIEI